MSDWALFDVAVSKPIHACTGDDCPTCARSVVTDPLEAALAFAADWRMKADTWFAGLPRGYRFTSEDITHDVGFPAGEQGMNRNNAVGAFIKALKFHKRIKNVDYVPSRNEKSNGAVIGVWVKIN